MPLGTFSLRGFPADLGAAGLGRLGIGLGAHALEVSRSPAPRGRHGALEKSKKSKSVSRGTPSRLVEPRLVEPSRKRETHSVYDVLLCHLLTTGQVFVLYGMAIVLGRGCLVLD